MSIRLLLLSLGVTIALAQACSDDVDCTLNGVCNASSGTCTCYKPWTGTTCAQLDFGKVPAGIIAYGTWPLSTWGGNAIFYENEWHMFVSTGSTRVLFCLDLIGFLHHDDCDGPMSALVYMAAHILPPSTSVGRRDG